MSYNDSRYGQQQHGNGERSGYNGNRRRGNRRRSFASYSSLEHQVHAACVCSKDEYDDRRRGGNYGDRDREPQSETIEQRLRNVIVKFADEQVSLQSGAALISRSRCPARSHRNRLSPRHLND